MKKITIFGTLALLLIASCTKLNTTPSQLDLKEDADFQEYVIGTRKLLQSVSVSAQNRNKIPFAKSNDEIKAIFGEEDYNRIQNWSIQSDALLNRIENKYGELDLEIVKEQAIQVLSRNDGVSLSTTAIACDKQYYTCMANVFATAVICHASCVSTTIAAPVCLALCITIEIYQGIDCADKWCNKTATDKLKTNSN